MHDRLVDLLKWARGRCEYRHDCEECVGYGKGEDCYEYFLADYLLYNGVIVLPCKVGDTVYKVWYTECHNGETHPDSFGCCGCTDECDMYKTMAEVKAPTLDFIVRNFMGNTLNGTYFLTKEAAEAALKGEQL